MKHDIIEKYVKDLDGLLDETRDYRRMIGESDNACLLRKVNNMQSMHVRGSL
jgi:hypothetical protein